MFLEELKKFSRQNWWVYIMLIIVLLLAYFTGKGNILEIFFLFLLNFIANLFVMIAIGNYGKNNNKVGSIYHVSGTILFLTLGLYGVFFQGFYQYIIFQISFLIAATKAFTFYNFKKNIKIFNEKTMVVLNIILITIFIKYFNTELYAILQVIGFSLVTMGLVSMKDKFRFFGSIIGTFVIILGSIIGVYLSYKKGDIDGISLGYTLISTTALIYYIKLLPNYIKKK